jgi:quercetin dioxygenase-like cupin family protein
MHVRVFVDADGRTQFAPLDLESAPTQLTGGIFATRPAGSIQDWHNAESPMYIITLSGQMEVEIEGGRKMPFGPGDVRLAEDTSGPGHVSRVMGDEPWQFVVLFIR